MRGQEPLSVFTRPIAGPIARSMPDASGPAFWRSARRLRIAGTLAAFSVAVMIVLIAANVASAAAYCFKNGF